MSYIYSQALVAAFSRASCSDTDASPPSSGNPMPKPCLWHDKTMEPSRLSRFGMMCKPLTDDPTEALQTWLQAVSPAKTSALLGGVQDLTENAVECGTTWPASLAKYDPTTHTLKTPQLLLIEDLTGCSVTLPHSGLMRNGECWERPMLELTTSGSESGFWAMTAASDATRGGTITPNMTGQSLVQMVNTPSRWPTPTVCGNYNRKGVSATSGDGLATAVALWPTPQERDYRSGNAPDSPRAIRKREAGWSPNLNNVVMWPTATATAYKGWSPNHNRAATDDRLDYSVERQGFQPGQQTPPMRLNPNWVEWLMGWPIGHTALKLLETAKYQEWQQQHSNF